MRVIRPVQVPRPGDELFVNVGLLALNQRDFMQRFFPNQAKAFFDGKAVPQALAY